MSRSGPDDPGGRLNAERKKICGNNDMDGTGRNYSRRMGVIKHNGSTTGENDLTQVKTVAVNDEIFFLISDTKIPKNYLEEK